MKIKRYVARTSREALARLREDLGADAIVLDNRQVPEGVELLAMADEPSRDAAQPGEAGLAAMRFDGTGADRAPADRAGAGRASGAETVASDPTDAATAEAMSTVSFEAYVRDRQRRRRLATVEAAPPAVRDVQAKADSASFPAPGSSRETSDAYRVELRHDPHRKSDRKPAQESDPRPVGEAPSGVTGRAVPRGAGLSASNAAPVPTSESGDGVSAGELMSELRAMRGFLSDQIESMSWFEGVRRRPAQSRMLRQLLNAGFSAALSRKLADHLPADFGDAHAEQWLRAALRRNLRVDAPGESVFDAGGTFALLGPTGVGKTTTAAKIAAQFALRHGAQSVGLITADVYRIGAQDQLRTFGRLLGVPVHVAHDVATLADFLQLFMNKKLVLIDTAGVGQRDERVGELLSALASTQVRKVVVLNAAMQASAIDEVIEAYQASQSAGVVLSKVDEAVQLGGALDCLVRHRLTLQGIANGQRVPEDWHRPDAQVLIDRALAAATSKRPSAFSFDEAELAMLLTAGMRRDVPAREGGLGV